ncbi:MAG TPA: hypothetical protein VGQ09_05740 [Chitinophagaceae bacterium]|jgi:hypothetical protein|nr:hypothetical protein [Chitinophagaceae bacterium]
MTDKAATSSKKLSKKEARKIVYEKLAGALDEYRTSVKEKKFTSNLKKASKLFAADIAKAVARQRQKIQKPAKIKAVKPNLNEQQGNANEAIV